MRLDLIFTMRRDIDIFQPAPTQKILRVRRYEPLEHFLNDFKDHPNQQENKQKLSNEQEHSFLSLKKNLWKLRQQNDQNFPKKQKPL